jgi:hypothetical protein
VWLVVDCRLDGFRAGAEDVALYSSAGCCLESVDCPLDDRVDGLIWVGIKNAGR